MLTFGKKALRKFGVDGAVAFTILTRVIQAGGGLISIVFVTKYLSGSQQGYYYTFGSIIAIQLFFELGLSGIITQYTAHEFAHLKWASDGTLEGKEYYKSRLSSLLHFCVKWFGILSFILFVALFIVGYYFFSTYNKTTEIEWQKPWIILCLSTSLNLFIDPLLAFLDGLGEVKDMAKVRLLQKIFNVVFLFILFALGFNLYSSPLASLIAIVVTYCQIFFSNRKSYLNIVWKSQGEWAINYMKEIFPFQWRIALSWISGYFIFQLFNPVLFATEGAVVAGQMGLSLTALNGISSISYSWINTKIPMLSAFIAKKDYVNLDHVFDKTLKNASIICGLCLVSFLSIIYFLQFNGFESGKRFLPVLLVLLLGAATFANQFVYAISIYLRCHKEEALLLPSVVIGVLAGLSTIFLGKQFGVVGITVGYTAIILFISLTWCVFIFKQKKVLWHL